MISNVNNYKKKSSDIYQMHWGDQCWYKKWLYNGNTTLHYLHYWVLNNSKHIFRSKTDIKRLKKLLVRRNSLESNNQLNHNDPCTININIQNGTNYDIDHWNKVTEYLTKSVAQRHYQWAHLLLTDIKFTVYMMVY